MEDQVLQLSTNRLLAQVLNRTLTETYI